VDPEQPRTNPHGSAMGRTGCLGCIMIVPAQAEVGCPSNPASGVTDTLGGTLGGATDTVRGAADNLLGGEEKQR